MRRPIRIARPLAEGRRGPLFGGRRRGALRRAARSRVSVTPPGLPPVGRPSRRRRHPFVRRRVRAIWLPLVAVLVLTACAVALAADDPLGLDGPPADTPNTAPPPAVPPASGGQITNGPPPAPLIAWRRSRAVGLPFRGGRLIGGVQLPAEGPDWFTWDPVRKESPNRSWRRWGTDTLVRTTLDVLAEYRAAHPDAPRVGIGDLSRPRGGTFDARFGGLGHASHQNGLDVDIYYPRRDGLERRAYSPRQVDRALAQDLVDRFVGAGARYIFVGPRVGLTGKRKVVSKLAHHDDHLHIRIGRPRR